MGYTLEDAIDDAYTDLLKIDVYSMSRDEIKRRIDMVIEQHLSGSSI